MVENTVPLTPRKPTEKVLKGSPLTELASLACSFDSTPVTKKVEGKVNAKSSFSPIFKGNHTANIERGKIDKLNVKLEFNKHDMDICSELSLLKSSPKKTVSKREKRQLRLSLENYVNSFSEDSVEPKSVKRLKRKKRKKNEKNNSSQAQSPRKKRKNEWNDNEIIILLHITKIMIDCELKSVAKALFECIERSPGKSYGRAAEKKLKRMEIFENWKKCDRKKIIENIDKKLRSFGPEATKVQNRVLQIAQRYRNQELGQRFYAKTKHSKGQSVSGVKSKRTQTNQKVTYEVYKLVDAMVKTICQAKT